MDYCLPGQRIQLARKRRALHKRSLRSRLIARGTAMKASKCYIDIATGESIFRKSQPA